MDQDAICALATGPGNNAIAVIRLSGKHCHELLKPLIKRKGPFVANELRLAKIITPENGEVLDDAMVVFFFAPASFTGEDQAELHLHGGSYIVKSVLSALFKAGFRAAHPGEFTRRAFLNGKMDLSCAEGIAALIHASSKQQWQAAKYLASGKLKKVIENLRAELLHAMSYLEAQIDFPDEHETASLTLTKVDSFVEKVAQSIETLRMSYQSGRVASEGLRVVLLGKPNAGKSTLLNTLLQFERSIVSEQPGTTRDYIEESCLVAGRLIRIIDTAGLRATQEDIEKQGIERTKQLAKDADLIIAITEGRANWEEAKKHSLELRNESMRNNPEGKEQIILNVWSKSDLFPLPKAGIENDWIALSCKEELGLKELSERIAKACDLLIGEIDEKSNLITTARQKSALDKAYGAVLAYKKARNELAYEEMLAFELMEVSKALIEIVGSVDKEEILDEIFSTFCLGK